MESNFQMTENVSTTVTTNKINKTKKPIEIRVNIVSTPKKGKTNLKRRLYQI